MVKKQIEEAKEEINGNVADQNPAPAVMGAETSSNKAYSIVFDSKLNKWLAIELLFDYQSGTFGGMRVVEQNPQKYIITERFNVLVGQNLL